MNDFPAFDPSIAEEFGTAGGDISMAIDFLGVPLLDGVSLSQLVLRFAFNLLMCWIVVYCFYFRKSRRKDFFTTFILFNTTMFLLICLMKNVNMQIGLTLGLFAIFGMIRYRTETVPIREMTYLFVITGMAVINGLAMAVSYAELITANLLFVIVIAVIENSKFMKHKATKLVLYEKIDLIVPEKREELIADLEKRTGLKITAVEVGHIDFLRDVAFIKISYELLNGEQDTIGNVTKPQQFVG